MPNNKLAIPLVGAEEIAPTSTPRTEKNQLKDNLDLYLHLY